MREGGGEEGRKEERGGERKEGRCCVCDCKTKHATDGLFGLFIFCASQALDIFHNKSKHFYHFLLNQMSRDVFIQVYFG